MFSTTNLCLPYGPTGFTNTAPFVVLVVTIVVTYVLKKVKIIN